MNISDFAIVIPIAIICYVIGLGLKALKCINDACIPVLISICGGILGVIAMFTMSSCPANDILTAIAIGIMSGLASTGSNQIYKQLNKFFKGEE